MKINFFRRPLQSYFILLSEKLIEGAFPWIPLAFLYKTFLFFIPTARQHLPLKSPTFASAEPLSLSVYAARVCVCESMHGTELRD